MISSRVTVVVVVVYMIHFECYGVSAITHIIPCTSMFIPVPPGITVNCTQDRRRRTGYWEEDTRPRRFDPVLLPRRNRKSSTSCPATQSYHQPKSLSPLLTAGLGRFDAEIYFYLFEWPPSSADP